MNHKKGSKWSPMVLFIDWSLTWRMVLLIEKCGQADHRLRRFWTPPCFLLFFFVVVSFSKPANWVMMDREQRRRSQRKCFLFTLHLSWRLQDVQEVTKSLQKRLAARPGTSGTTLSIKSVREYCSYCEYCETSCDNIRSSPPISRRVIQLPPSPNSRTGRANPEM